LLDGKEIDILHILAIDTVFNDSKKGTHASSESLQTVFGTNNIAEIATKIIKKGDIQLTTEQRSKMQRNKKIALLKLLQKTQWILKPKLRIQDKE